MRIDRDSAIPARQQVRAALVTRIASGALAVGDPLPSVRELAERARLAPMTVTRVYADLKASGLVEARAGAGTFVSESALSRLGATGGGGLWASIDRLVAEAASHGLGMADLLSLVAARDPAPAPAPRVVMVGLFAEATRSYAARVGAQTGLAPESIALLDEAPDEAELARRLAEADLVLTFANLHDRLAGVVADPDRIVTLRFIPAEATRTALAALDPMARLVAVSRFEDFLPILTLGVRRFAAHVRSVTPRVQGAADLPALLARADVVVMSTGAEAAAEAARPGATFIEYRHVPDPGDIDRLVAPRLGLPVPDSRKEAS
ncbi:GntR family transcriptional regulator [uncultured Jannaschia sp.]|uniref:GntR family transcriptional regulator n=1 Tax=uncultured Jannaschia sp. TaxID=293347 RepID=UPI002639D0F0|nr:GntR family transcriptional regulator [uncultured Jannaschia sp.]